MNPRVFGRTFARGFSHYAKKGLISTLNPEELSNEEIVEDLGSNDLLSAAFDILNSEESSVFDRVERNSFGKKEATFSNRASMFAIESVKRNSKSPQSGSEKVEENFIPTNSSVKVEWMERLKRRVRNNLTFRETLKKSMHILSEGSTGSKVVVGALWAYQVGRFVVNKL